MSAHEPLFSGFRLCLRGCNANNGVQSGSAALNVNNAVTSANVNWGSPLNFFKNEIQCVLKPRPLAKNKLKAKVLVDRLFGPKVTKSEEKQTRHCRDTVR